MTWTRKFDFDETLDKAMAVFWAQGFESTSMQDLVNGTGINRASIYGTYGDKRAFFLAALHRYDTDVRQTKIRNFERFEPVEAIRGFLESFITEAREQDPVRGCFMTNTALEMAPHDPDVHRIVTKAQAGIAEFFTRMIRRGQKTGTISEVLDPAGAGRLLLADTLGLVVLCRSGADEETLYGIIDQAIARLR